MEIDADNGVAVDPASGTVTGVKKLRREAGSQITGYLVELAEKHPELAGSYVGAVKYYWKSRAQGKAEPGAGEN